MKRILLVSCALTVAAAVLAIDLGSEGPSIGPSAEASVGRWFRRAFRKIGNGFKRFARGVKRGFQKAGKAIKKGFQKVGKAFKKAGKAIKKGFQKVGKAFKKAGQWLKKNIGDIACQAAGPICTITRFVANYKKNIKKAKKFMSDRIKKIKKSFFAVLNLDDFKRFPKVCLLDFSGSLVKNLGSLMSEFNKIIGIAFPLDKIAGYGVAAAIAGVAATGFCPLAAIHIGVKKLVAWAIPKLILGIGAAYNAASANKHAKNFGSLLSFVLKAVGVAGDLGVIGQLLGGKGSRFKERATAVLRKIADVSGRIQKGLEAGLKVANALASGEFTTIDAALKSASSIPTKLGPQDIVRMIDGLKGLVLDQVWSVLQKPLRKLVGKALALLGKLLDIPRNALVGAVGTIPFAGGVLAAALNFLLGMGVDFIFNFLTEQIEKLVQGILKNQVIEPVASALKRELTRSGRNVKAAQGVLKLVKAVADLAGDVNKALKSASSKQTATLGALARTALERLLLRGISHAGLRGLIAKAVGAVADAIASRKLGLAEAMAQVLRKVGPELPGLVTSQIRDPQIRAAVRAGVSAVTSGLSASSVRSLASGPTGFFKALAVKAFEGAKAQLGAWLAAHGGQAGQVLASLGKTVSEDGLGALFRLDTYLLAATRK